MDQQSIDLAMKKVGRDAQLFPSWFLAQLPTKKANTNEAKTLKEKMARHAPSQKPMPNPALIAEAVALLKKNGVEPLPSGEYVIDGPGNDYWLVK